MGFLPDSAQKVVHVTMHGTCWEGAEEWQTGFYLGYADQDAAAPTQAAADFIRDQWIAFFSSQQGNIANNFKFDTCKMALLRKDGHYDGEAVESHPAGTVSGGAISTQPLPPQVALVATLIGGSGKGLAGKGRMYLPGVNAFLQGNGHITGTAPQDIANKLAAFFNALDADPTVDGHVINVSRGHKTDILGVVSYDGARNVKVNGVRVGDVYDTQRRRRNALNEVYKSAVVAD